MKPLRTPLVMVAIFLSLHGAEARPRLDSNGNPVGRYICGLTQRLHYGLTDKRFNIALYWAKALPHVSARAWDIEPRGENIDQQDATTRMTGNISCFITNPPWERTVLHKIIANLAQQERTWLLLDADWMHTRQAAPFWPRCSLVVSIGRVKWIKESKFTGKDNCCWYRFDPWHVSGPRFIGRDPEFIAKREAA